MKYSILKARDVEELTNLVNAAIAKGHIVVGGVSVASYNQTLWFYQAMYDPVIDLTEEANAVSAPLNAKGDLVLPPPTPLTKPSS